MKNIYNAVVVLCFNSETDASEFSEVRAATEENQATRRQLLLGLHTEVQMNLGLVVGAITSEGRKKETVFSRSLKERLIPRCSVIRILVSKGLIKKMISINALSTMVDESLQTLVTKTYCRTEGFDEISTRDQKAKLQIL
ncbi:hypothetical protein C5167_000366 [Papaver somniferum]|uniref:Uncharacterized protein n=1 Tax=Papaver somniferum TaxID=3469 RepID=A0A4Y7KV46_PAPSO|nr:hypothetical protein C5167_000366 [Papaver somniferum]